ncbi:class I adenylate-forming enzyme family protein [Sulfuracidifex tepidarius]|uniref:4-hydroxybutyrate--CoA ligase 1 n=1 Tax=Sulfuracidifex tepidarius TaxID=1294262 RepID=A0A510E2F6_9CREN|nr:class I adenylate-forming enzyme family protein [Sulfuracidifex tepidarius]BBG26686.1 4-hydroxybutyrate--CoA ligase 1 [Sulfuracidifex tepidarius]
MSYGEALEKWYKEKPSSTFLIDSETSMTFEQVKERVSSIASILSPGDTVAHIMNNSLKSVLFYLASFWAGAKIVAIDPLTSAEDLKFILDDSKPDIVFTDEEILQREKEYLKGYKAITDVDTGNKVNTPYSYTEDETGLIYYYAGIAGKTMQVKHSAQRVRLNAISLLKAISLTEVKSILTVPIAHVLGNSVFGVTLEAGGKMYVMKRFSTAEASSAISKYSLNYLATVPMIYDSFNSSDSNLSSLELCVSTAAPLFPKTVEQFKQKYGKDIVQQYGFTEGLVITFQPKELSGVISLGKPLPNAEIKIVDNKNKEVGKNETGELLIKAPWLMLGYNDQEETEKVFHEGWLKSGDLVSMDNKGLLYFRGVKKRMLKYKGYPIFPRDLEEILLTHPDVISVEVKGEDAGNLGQQPVAYVKVKGNVKEEDLMNYVNSKVAFYKRLKRIYIEG